VIKPVVTARLYRGRHLADHAELLQVDLEVAGNLLKFHPLDHARVVRTSLTADQTCRSGPITDWRQFISERFGDSLIMADRDQLLGSHQAGKSPKRADKSSLITRVEGCRGVVNG